MKLRIKFIKKGPIKFIGHLDVMRYFQKTLRRAEVDVAYSTGFSPHQIMSFAAPLGVGLESNGEYFDVEVHTPISSQEFMDRVNAVSIAGIQIVDVRLLPEKAGNAMASVAAAGYTIRFREDRAFKTESWQQKFTEFMAKEHIFITKKTKSGTAEIDLKPAVYDYSLVSDTKNSGKNIGIYLLVNASSEGNIKPNLVIDAFSAFLGEELPENALMITREETYGIKRSAAGDEKMIPLSDFGDII